jgi:hypothetical protein
MKDPILVATSTVFLIPATYAAYCQYWHIYGSFISLLMSSLIHHSSKNSIILRIDQANIVHNVVLACIVGNELQLLYVAFPGFIWIMYVYGYGYMTSTCAFSNNYVESRLWHGSMHIVGSALWMYGLYVKHQRTTTLL